MKNKYAYKLLFLSVFIVPLITGCLEEKEVQGPIPYVTAINTALNIDDNKTFTGNYKPQKISLSPLPNSPEVTYLNSAINIYPNPATNALEYNYAVQKTGYNTNGDLIKDGTLKPLGNVTLNGSYIIILENPIQIHDNNVTYYIHNLQKINDNMIAITDNIVSADITEEYRVCDPKIQGNTDENSCSSVTGAMKYIGYYRVEDIFCGNTVYEGGKDFAGEMTAAPSLGGEGKNPLDVTIPITLKIQVLNSSDLKSCLFTQEQQNNNIYYSQDTFTLNDSDYTGEQGLLGAFTKVGLIGLNTENETERTTQIRYEPKSATRDNEGNFPDKTFGNNNKVSMRLKIMQSGELQQPPVMEIDNNGYFTEN